MSLKFASAVFPHATDAKFNSQALSQPFIHVSSDSFETELTGKTATLATPSLSGISLIPALFVASHNFTGRLNKFYDGPAKYCLLDRTDHYNTVKNRLCELNSLPAPL